MMKFISDCLLISTEVTLVMLLMLFITVIATVVAVKVAKGTKNSDPLQRELENLELKDVTEVYKAVKSHMQKTVLDEDELKKIEAEKRKRKKKKGRQERKINPPLRSRSRRTAFLCCLSTVIPKLRSQTF